MVFWTSVPVCHRHGPYVCLMDSHQKGCAWNDNWRHSCADRSPHTNTLLKYISSAKIPYTERPDFHMETAILLDTRHKFFKIYLKKYTYDLASPRSGSLTIKDFPMSLGQLFLRQPGYIFLGKYVFNCAV